MHKKAVQVMTESEIWSDAATSKENQGLLGAIRSKEEARKNSSVEVSEGAWSC